jgi:hypothetical protein
MTLIDEVFSDPEVELGGWGLVVWLEVGVVPRKTDKCVYFVVGSSGKRRAMFGEKP